MKILSEGTLEDYIDLGFDVTIEADKNMEDDNDQPSRYMCILYYGDSNGPWKKGTIKGDRGFGMTLLEAFENARKNLKIVN